MPQVLSLQGRGREGWEGQQGLERGASIGKAVGGKSGEEERISTGRKQFGRLEENIMLNIQTKAVLAHLCMGTTILVACLPMYTGKALILLETLQIGWQSLYRKGCVIGV